MTAGGDGCHPAAVFDIVPLGSGFSLIGLVGGGSIPLAIACLVGLLTILGLSALNHIGELPHKQRRKEKPMSKSGKIARCKPQNTVRHTFGRSMIMTLWAIGAGIASGSALSG